MSESVRSAAAVDRLAAEVVAEITDRLHAGERVDVEAYVVRHPELADRLRRLLPALAVLDRFSSSAGPDGPGAAAGGGEAMAGTLGDFRLVREVGRGGMGVVYEAEQLSLGRRVALKVLPFAATMDPRQLQRFHNEARAAASLHHEHIVPVYGVGCERAVHFYAMQFIEGQSLAELIVAQRQAPSGRERHPSATTAVAAPTEAPRDAAYFRRVAAWGVQAAEALEHAHALGIVHRDVKPANLIVDGRGKLWVTDFGLARTVTDAGLTMTGDLVGTLRYMSPEQALARHGLMDHRTDVYSLGATLYELLTGRPAVEGQDRQDILRRVAEDEPRPPRALDRGVPTDLDTVVLKALAKEPAERYATARELADDLRRFLEDRPIQARRPSSLHRVRKWCRRHKQLMRAGAAAAVLAVVGLAVAAALIWRENQQKSTALAEKEAALDQARRERDVAAEQRRWARAAVDDMYVQVASKWLEQHGKLADVQREFLVKALRYYQGAMKEQGNDLEVRRGAYNAATWAANIQHQLGEYPGAEEAWRQAIALAQGLADDFPREAQYRVCLANVHNSLGNLLDNAGRCPEAEEEYQQGLVIFKRVVDEHPGNGRYRQILGGVYNNLGELARKTGRPREAEEALHQAVAVWDRAAADFPEDRGLRMTSAMGHTNLANTLTDSSPREAAEHGRKALGLLRRLADEHPEERDCRYHLGVTYYTLSRILDPTEQPREVANGPEAVRCLREAVAAFGKVVDDFPRMVEYRWRLAMAQGALGVLLAAEQQTEAAARALGQAADAYRKLVREAPGAPEYRSELACYQRALGRLLMRTGQAQRAEEAFRQARDLSEKLVADFPGQAKYRADLALLLLTCPVEKLRDVGRAVEQARQAAQLAPQMRDYLYLLGQAHYRAGDWKASREVLLKMEERPEGGYGHSWFFLALAEGRLGHKEEARRWHDKAVQWTEQYGPENEELRALRAEAAALLGVPGPSSPKEKESPPK